MKRLILLIMISVSILSADITRDDTSGIVTDSSTNLQWQDDAVGSAMRWTSAINYCEDLSLGGYSDWRLPNINELKSIIDRSKTDPAILTGFENTGSGAYWSSTTFEYVKNYAWFVYFNYGYVSNFFKVDDYYVRCVRDRQ